MKCRYCGKELGDRYADIEGNKIETVIICDSCWEVESRICDMSRKTLNLILEEAIKEIKSLRNLTEHSHFYTARILEEAIKEIKSLRNLTGRYHLC
jgi:hypothetical protein